VDKYVSQIDDDTMGIIAESKRQLRIVLDMLEETKV
jgi:hypothetical protein